MIVFTPRRGLGLAAASALVVVAAAQPSIVLAQGASNQTLDEVIVTARKSEERLVDVPLAIKAFGAAEIEQKGIRNLDDVAEATPGLTFSDLQSGFLPTPVIRGFAPIDVRGENNAAVFVDGVYVSGREGLNFSQLDLERIEVIKGPQAAIYGRNSFSGALNYVTAKPTDTVKGKAEVQFGSHNKVLASMSVSGPLIEGVLKGRAAVGYDSFDGSYENQFAGIGPGSKIGGYRYETFQGALLWTPNEAFSGELSLYVSNDNTGNAAISPVATNCENLNSLLPANTRVANMNYCGTFQGVGRQGLSAIPQAVGDDRDLIRAQLNLSWKTGIGTITSLTGYSKLNQDFYVDGSRDTGETVKFAYISTPLTPLAGGAFQAGTRRTFETGLLQVGGGAETEEVSTELRLSSDPENRFRWSTGLYYYDTKASGGNDGVVGTKALPADFYSFCLACSSAAAVGGSPLLTLDFAGTAGNDIFGPWFRSPTGDAIFATTYENKVQAPSVFGSAEFDFAESWTGRLEARYTDEKKSFTNFLTNRSGSKKWGITNYRATLDYKPSTNMTIYGSYAHAEKSGSIGASTVQFNSDPSPAPNVAILTSFDPEENDAFELGMKVELLDRRVYLDFDVYSNKWKNIVIPQIRTEVIDPRSGSLSAIRTPTSFNVNAGDGTINGAEFSVNARITEYVNGSFGVSYIDATYDNAKVDSFKDFPSYSPTGDVAGNQILRQSPWQVAASLGYKAPISNTTDWYLRGDMSYRDKQFADATNQAITPDLTKLNMQIGVQGEHWTVELWGRNLTNEDGPSGAYRDVFFSNAQQPDGTYFTAPAGRTPAGTAGRSTFFPWRYSVSYGALREYGITARYKF